MQILVRTQGEMIVNYCENLTRKEREVMGYVEKGLAARQITKEMGVSINTVKFHLRNIYSKLDVNSRELALTRLRMRPSVARQV